MKKVLITGIDSFTGTHLATYFEKEGYEVYGTSFKNKSNKIFKCDITVESQVKDTLLQIKPDYLIHLAGISFVAHNKNEDFYKVNTIAAINILSALVNLSLNPSKIILVSSATVYGNQAKDILDESLCPSPANHYGASKFAMESLAKEYFNKLSIIITRPFNYTGVGQANYFLVPKIVQHFKEKKEYIELGNLEVIREFNDVSFVCEIYKKLITSDIKSEIVNICSNRGIKLSNIIESMKKLTGNTIEVKINKDFVRKDEIKTLTGSTEKLFNLIGKIPQEDFENTLLKMLHQ